jgi:extracellular factor (EF) 3-hydroxypalmitic acid methyl ester biosynthesis protein
MRITGQNVVFEVYNPFSILQLSEVLREFKIIVREREIYSGRAVVSGLVNTGFMFMIDAALVDFWQDIDTSAIIRDKSRLSEEIGRFLSEMNELNLIQSEFKILVNDLRVFLSDLMGWFKQFDAVITAEHNIDRDQVSNELLSTLTPPFSPFILDYFKRLESLTSHVSPAMSSYHKLYLRRELHPVLLCSPFIHRTYTKPLGYAGDYEMINQILSDPHRGSMIYAKMINKFALSLGPAVAHRNRISILTQILIDKARQVIASGRRLKVLNIACGPSQEVRDFIAESPEANHCDITLLDFSPEAIVFSREKIEKLKQIHHCKINVTYIEKSIDTILKESIDAKKQFDTFAANSYDLVYCAGLFDYLTDNVCERLISLFYKWIAANGLLVVTNIHPQNSARYFMEYLLEWNVMYRDEDHFLRLADIYGDKKVFGDTTGVNIFLTVHFIYFYAKFYFILFFLIVSLWDSAP